MCLRLRYLSHSNTSHKIGVTALQSPWYNLLSLQAQLHARPEISTLSIRRLPLSAISNKRITHICRPAPVWRRDNRCSGRIPPHYHQLPRIGARRKFGRKNRAIEEIDSLILSTGRYLLPAEAAICTGLLATLPAHEVLLYFAIIALPCLTALRVIQEKIFCKSLTI